MTETPVDFYASSIALCAIVIFAKFVTHHARHTASSTRLDLNWCLLHWVTVALAWLGIISSLAVLGEAPVISGHWELTARWFVGVVVGAAGTALAIDVALTNH